MPMIKAVSLWQPWASLIAVGAKKYETRSWPTRYRGLLAIHAAKRWTADEHTEFIRFTHLWPELLPKLTNAIWADKPLPLGAVLCVCKLVTVVSTEAVRGNLTYQEYKFGNFNPGRFAWQMEVIEVFNKPIPARGEQGLFNWNWEQS